MGSGPTHAFLWQGGQSTDLGIFRGSGSTEAAAINDKGQVVGASHDQAFLWQNGKLTNLGRLGGLYAYPEAINNQGQVVGGSNAPPFDPKTRNFPYHPFLWQDGKMTISAHCAAITVPRAGSTIAAKLSALVKALALCGRTGGYRISISWCSPQPIGYCMRRAV